MTGPEGVRLRRADGTVLECELAYEGCQPQCGCAAPMADGHCTLCDTPGMHDWRIANAVYRPGDSITVEVMPGYTSLGFRARPELAGATIDWREHDGTQRRQDVKMNRKQRRRRWPRNS